MKQFIILLAITFLAIPSIQAQKLKKDNLGYYKYTQLPSDIKLVGLKSYNIEFTSDYYEDSYEKDKVEEAFNITGFDKIPRVEDKKGDFTVKIWKYAVKIGDSERKKRVEVKKKDGVETKINHYHYEAKATFKYVLRIYLNDEEIYMKENAGEEVVKGAESKSTGDAYENYKKARKDYRNTISSKKVKALAAQVDEIFGYPVKKINIRMAEIKAKKHSYEDYDAAMVDYKAGYAIVAADENKIDEAKISLEKAITAFETILKESDIDNKKARINKDITAALYINIGNCYLFMKDYAKAQEYYNKGQELKKLLFAVAGLNSTAADMQKRTEANAK